MPDQIKSVARLLGNIYAHVQHGMDTGIEWGFKQMQKAAKTEKPKKKSAPVTTGDRAMKLGKIALAFLGTAGDAYFKKYEELKKQK